MSDSATLTARVVPPPLLGGGGATKMLERNFLGYRRLWGSSSPGSSNPSSISSRSVWDSESSSGTLPDPVANRFDTPPTSLLRCSEPPR